MHTECRSLLFCAVSETSSGTMIKFLPLDILGASHRIPRKNKNAVYRLQIPALVLEIFKFQKCVNYANEMTDDIIYSTQYYLKYINRAMLANLHRRALKLGRLNTPMAIKSSVPMATHSFPVPTHLILICQ